MNAPKHPFIVQAIAVEDGGGFLVTFPDLPGCMADGKTVEEAIGEAVDAEKSWLTTAGELGWPQSASGRFVQRLPKSLHAKLIARAKQEGVSMNTMAVTLLAEGLGRKEESR